MKAENGENYRNASDRRPMTAEEKKIYNYGERLVFGVSHNIEEDIRHRSSYLFFRKIINNDLEFLQTRQVETEDISIVDLGCGVGHGCETLSEIKNSNINGIDSCQEAIDYARKVYYRSNISYDCKNLLEYIPVMPAYDYVVSRGVLEHIENGLELGFSTRWIQRLMFDVPYNEPPGRNPHHLLAEINEDLFADMSNINIELFYQDLAGIVYDQANKPVKPNMIICICTNQLLSKIKQTELEFPVPAWQP